MNNSGQTLTKIQIIEKQMKISKFRLSRYKTLMEKEQDNQEFLISEMYKELKNLKNFHQNDNSNKTNNINANKFNKSISNPKQRCQDVQQEQKQKNQYQCMYAVCSFNADNRGKLLQHMNSFHMESIFGCSKCGKFYQTRNRLENHLCNDNR